MLPTVHPTEICTDPLNFFCAGLYLGLFYGAVLRVGAVLQRHHRPDFVRACMAEAGPRLVDQGAHRGQTID